MYCMIRRVRGVVLDLLNELVEEVPAVVRSGTGFRVVLHGEDRLVSRRMPATVLSLRCSWVTRWARRPATPHHDEAVVLRGDLAFARDQILDGMVHPTVPLEHLLGGQALAEGDDLVPQTMPKTGCPRAMICLTKAMVSVIAEGVSKAVGNHPTGRLPGRHLLEGRAHGELADEGAALRKATR